MNQSQQSQQFHQTPQKSGFTLVHPFSLKKGISSEQESPLKQRVGLIPNTVQPQQIIVQSSIYFTGSDFDYHLREVILRQQVVQVLKNLGRNSLFVQQKDVFYQQQVKYPLYLELILVVLIESFKSFLKQNPQLVQEQEHFLKQGEQFPLQIMISENIWKNVIQIIAKKQFQFEEGDEMWKEITQIFLFQEEVATTIFRLVCNKRGSQMVLEGLFQFIQQIENKEKETLDHLAFPLYSQIQLFTIQREIFENEFTAKNAQISLYFEKNSNVIIQFLRREPKSKLNQNLEELVQFYLKLIGNFKKSNMSNFLPELAKEIFNNNLQIDKKTFLSNTKNISEKTGFNILTTFFEIIAIEIKFINTTEFFQQYRKYSNSSNSQSNLNTNTLQNPIPINLNNTNNNNNHNTNETNSSSHEEAEHKQNYYLKSIDKLLNKCVFNGDACCNCKKCQCIRRNRNSAKESQKRKRDALIQIGPLQEKYEQVVQKCNQLEQENKIYKEILEKIVKKFKKDEISNQNSNSNSNEGIKIEESDEKQQQHLKLNFQLLQDIFI